MFSGRFETIWHHFILVTFCSNTHVPCREAEGADASSKVEAETEEVRTKLENGLAVEAAPESASLPAVASPPAAAPKPLGTWAKIAAKPAPEPSSEETQAA